MSKELVAKLARIQSTLKAPKSQYNKFGQYAYRNQEDILEAVKPLLLQEGLFQTISDDIVTVGGRVYVKATVTVTDGESSISNSAFAREPQDQKGMNEAQITGSASSYARKYALNGMYAIDDTKDADATNDHGKTAPLTKDTAKSTPNTEKVLDSVKQNEQAANVVKEEPKKASKFAPKAKPAVTETAPSEDGGWG